MVHRFKRVLRHLVCDRADVRRAFPAAGLARIEARIAEGERRHGAEIRVAIEPSITPGRVLRGLTPRNRALEVFGRLRVWDTEANNGVLIYLLLADHAVELVADRAAARAIPEEVWRSITQGLSAAFRQGRFVDGVLAALDALDEHLAPAFPPGARNVDELPNRPSIL